MKYLRTLLLISTLSGLTENSFSQITAPSTPDTSRNSNNIFVAVQQSPQFPGGMQAFGQFLSTNIRYPKIALQAKISGTVYAQFVVERDGSLTDIRILRDPGSGLGDEATRVLQLSPKWTAGVQNGKNVRVQFVVPVKFNMDNPPPAMVYHNTPLDTTKGKIYSAVETNPVFPGGEVAFRSFLSHNIRYPREAKEKGITGRVFIQFVVEKDGSLTDLRLMRDPGAGLGAEALRVLSQCPNWKPGTQNNAPVRVLFTVPINFSLNNNAITPSQARNIYNAIPDSIKLNFAELMRHLATHTSYPLGLINQQIKGTIVTVLTIDSDHQVSAVNMVKDANPDLDIQVSQALKTYIRPVNVKPGDYSVIVNFNIGDLPPELGNLNPYTKSTIIAGILLFKNKQ